MSLNCTLKDGESGGNSLAVQWLGLCASNAAGTGSIPGWGTKIPYAAWRGKKKKVKVVNFMLYIFYFNKK